jgi:uncharacterized protein YdeI (YjbR/CyaY-like superfamily)
MKPKTDPRVDAYIAKSAAFAQPILRHVRKLVHQACPEAEETIKWSMPSFTHGGRILCGMAAFKAHCAVWFWHQKMHGMAKRGVKGSEAMGHLGRITSLAGLPPDQTILRYVRKTKELNETGGPARARPKARKPLPVPADLSAGLRKTPPAAASFQAFSSSQRREYIEWITEAKRPETRAQRLATTLEWLAEGRKRNWKYENC